MPVSAGLLGEQGSGRGMLIAPPPSGVAPGAVTVAVTDEPPRRARGSERIDPTGRVALSPVRGASPLGLPDTLPPSREVRSVRL